jgi:hypothetical protein
MTQADSVLSTPPTNTSLTRRNMIGAMATVGAAAIATAAPAIAGLAEPDPIYAAIDAFRRADALCVAVEGDIPDDVGDCWSEAISVVMRTRPTTPAGLAALTSWARERADWLDANASLLNGEDLCALTAAIDDATRGMSGLKPWLPPLPALVAASTLVGPHPDAALLDLGLEYERLLAIEEPLREESFRIWNAADRLRYEKLGIDPDDHEARGAALNERHNEWNEAREVADKELGYHKAWKKMDRASSKTARVGKKILKIAPATMAGLLARVRVIETHDEILVGEPTENLVAQIRDFAKRAAAVRS